MLGLTSVLLKYGRQMRPMNPPGDPRSYHRWSIWRQMYSLGFAENVSEWKSTDDSTDALIWNVHFALVKCGPYLVHFEWLHGLNRFLIGGLPRTETDHPTINHRWSVRRARILPFLQHCYSSSWRFVLRKFASKWAWFGDSSSRRISIISISCLVMSLISRSPTGKMHWWGSSDCLLWQAFQRTLERYCRGTG